MKYFYLDSSVAVRIVMGHSESAAAWFDKVTDDPDSTVFSSRLLRTELTRVLRREGIPVVMRDELLDYMGSLPFSELVLVEAEAIIPHIKTLDAIHLACLIRSGIDATVVTHDQNMRRVAEEIGFPVLDPVAS